MEFNVTREQWVERFAIHLANLEIGAEPDALAEVATRLWATSGHLDPETAADQEFATRLRASELPAASTSTIPLGVAGESAFERTERIPVERLHAAGEYVRDNDEWIARCVRRVLELDPIIKAEEAQPLGERARRPGALAPDEAGSRRRAALHADQAPRIGGQRVAVGGCRRWDNPRHEPG